MNLIPFFRNMTLVTLLGITGLLGRTKEECNGCVCWRCEGSLQKGMSNSCPQEPVKVTLLGKRVFADIIKLRVLRQYYFRCRVRLKSNDKCSYKRRPVIQKGAVWRQARLEYLEPVEAERSKDSPLEPSERAWPPPIHWLWTSGLQNSERINLCFQPPSLFICYGSSRKPAQWGSNKYLFFCLCNHQSLTLVQRLLMHMNFIHSNFIWQTHSTYCMLDNVLQMFALQTLFL